jgi:stress-induced morphogen
MADPKLKRRIREFLRSEFVHAPEDRIRVKDGYADNVHVEVVSDRFTGLSLRDRHQLLWDLLFEGLPKDVWGMITLTQDFTPGEYARTNGRRRTNRA